MPAARRKPRRPAKAAERAAALARLPSHGDAGPKERYQHGDTIRAEPGEVAGLFVQRVTTQSVLDRYLQRGQISQRQFDAGMKLYRLWRASGSARSVISNYGPRIDSAKEISERQAILRHKVTETLREMGRLSEILVHVCLCDQPAREWASSRRDAPQAGVVVLRLALDTLADHFKI